MSQCCLVLMAIRLSLHPNSALTGPARRAAWSRPARTTRALTETQQLVCWAITLRASFPQLFLARSRRYKSTFAQETATAPGRAGRMSATEAPRTDAQLSSPQALLHSWGGKGGQQASSPEEVQLARPARPPPNVYRSHPLTFSIEKTLNQPKPVWLSRSAD